MERKPEMKVSRQEVARQYVTASKGGHVFYEIDAGSVVERLKGILTVTRLLESAMGADSGAAMKATSTRPRKPVVKGRSHAG